MPSSGGRKPVRASVGSSVCGSIDSNHAVTRPVLRLMPSVISTSNVSLLYVMGTVVSYDWAPCGIVMRVLPKPTPVNAKVDQLRLGSSWSVTTTSWAGAVAVGWFSNWT